MIDFIPDNAKDSRNEVDAETVVSAAAVAFNNAALPPDMPEWLKDAIRAEASVIVETMRDDEIRLADAKQRREDEQDNQASMAQAMAAREREWDQSRVSIGTVAMSGEEWDQAYELLSDPHLRSQLIQSMMRKKGWTQDRAEKAADDALTLAQIAQKQKDGTITEADETQAETITRRNPDAAVMVREAARADHRWGMETAVDRSASAQSNLSGDITIAAKARQSAVQDAAVDVKAGSDKAFTSAPALAYAFDKARNEPPVTRTDEPAIKALPSRLIAQIDMSRPF